MDKLRILLKEQVFQDLIENYMVFLLYLKLQHIFLLHLLKMKMIQHYNFQQN